MERMREHGTLDATQAGVNEMRVTPAMRFQALLVAFFSALHAVITVWRSYHFQNSRIDALLARDGRTEQLGGFRDAMNHPNRVTDPRILALRGQYRPLLDWADQVLEALEGHFEPLFELARRRVERGTSGG
jgi:hypothetical protein